MSASLGLYRLQQVDRQLDRINTQLEKIRQTLENDSDLKNALALLNTTEGEYKSARQALQVAEAETEAQKIKIQQNESSLYSGSVHNPKELQDLQKDVASLKKYLVTLEERQLEAMEKAEQAETAHSTARSALEVLQSKLGNEHKSLLDEQSTLKKDLERFGEEREASVSPVEESLLKIYSDLRKQKRGVAVTEFSDNSCNSCGANLTASLQQNAKSPRQLFYCPSCGRVLYAS